MKPLNEVTLTRLQLDQLHKITEQFKDVNTFTIKWHSPSGIGPSTSVHFALSGADLPVSIDITDVSVW